MTETPTAPTRDPEPSPPEASEAPAPPPGGDRVPFFDNAKYLAIVLVAVGHAWEPYREGSRAVTAAYMFVYAFHMPAFIVIAGYFSRNFDGGRERMRRLVTGVLVPYVVFELAYTFFKRWADGDTDYPLNLTDPYFLTWFLLALFLWRLTVPFWNAVRWPVPIAVAVSVLSSVTPGIGGELDLQRVLQFMPFFVLGLRLRAGHFERLRGRAVRAGAVVAAAAGLALAYAVAPVLDWDWFYHRDAGQELGFPTWAAVAIALTLLATSLVLTAAFLAWVPRRRTWFTVLGAGTLYGYLLHGFPTKAVILRGWYDPPWLDTPLGVAGVTLAAAAVVTLLCTPPVRRVFRVVTEPRMEWAFRR